MSQRTRTLIWRLFLVTMVLLVAWLARGFRWSVVVESAPFLLRGLRLSWILTLISTGIGMVAGSVLAVLRVHGPPGVRHVVIAYIEIIRATPQLMVIFWVFFTYPSLTGRTPNPSVSAIVSLSMIAAAYLAEVIRAGLASVPRLQIETAYSAGLNAWHIFRYVVFPQALRNMIPAFIAQFVMLFKTTSVVYVIGLVDFFRAIILVNNRDFAPYALYTTMAAGYFVCSYVLSTVVRRLDPKYLLVS